MVHIEKFWVVLLFGLIALLRTIAGKVEEARKRNQNAPRMDATYTSPATELEADAGTDAERMRRFLEALGQPPGTTPPPKIERRGVAPPPIPEASPRPLADVERKRSRSITINPLPPLVTRPPAEPPRAEISAPPPVSSPSSLSQQSVEVLMPDVYEIASASADQSGGSLRDLLRAPNGLRNAIILREIFGPPRALQPMLECGSA